MKFPKVKTDTVKAFEMYHSLPYFTGGDICELFECCPSTAIKIKKMVNQEMIKQNIKLYCEHSEYVDKDVLYKMAGLDIEKINKSYKKIKELMS